MATHQISLEEEETMQLSFLPARIAEALCDDEPTRKMVRMEIAAEVSQMVDSGALVVRDPLTLEPFSFERRDVPGFAVLTADDLRPLLEPKGVSLDIRKPGDEQKVIRILAQHISVEDAITLVIHARVLRDDVGEDGLTPVERAVDRMEKDFLSVCKELGITPRDPFKELAPYSNEATNQNDLYEITTDELKRYASYYGVAIAESIETDGTNVEEAPKERRARLLEWQDEEERHGRGALARVVERESKRRGKPIDRSNIGTEIRKAKQERAEEKRDGRGAALVMPTSNNPFGVPPATIVMNGKRQD